MPVIETAGIQYVTRVSTVTFVSTGATALEWALVPYSGEYCPGRGTPAAGNDDADTFGAETTVCVTPGADNTRETANSGDDTVTGAIGTNSQILAGPNGRCDTIAAGTDVQEIANGAGRPTCVYPTPRYNGTRNMPRMDTRDVTCGNGICAGPDGICHTSVTANGVDGNPSAGYTQSVTAVGDTVKCITYGANFQLQTTPTNATPFRTRAVSALAGMNLGASVTDVAGNTIDTHYNQMSVTTTTNAGTVVSPVVFH
jgi:hypothetical protein